MRPETASKWERPGSLLLGTLLMALWGTPLGLVTAWLHPALMLRFTRLSSPGRGFLLVSAAQMAGTWVLLRGVVPVPPAQYAMLVVTTGLFGGIILLVDRLLATRLQGLARSLVYPCTAVAAAFVVYPANPFGTWGEPAYGQIPFAPLIQFAAVAGVWGIGFLILWWASVANEWRACGLPGARRPVLAFAAASVLVLGWGAARLTTRPAAQTARVAAVTFDPALERAFSFCRRDDAACFRERTGTVNQRLFARTRAAAEAGAKIVLWSEGAAEVLAPDEAALVARGRAVARERGITLIMAVAVIPVSPGTWENKLIAVNPDGSVAWEYLKARPVPGEPVVAGDGRVPVLDTPVGRLAAVICFDADFPELVRQAGEQGAGLILVAANDWPRIAGVHRDMALVRGVENGASLLRATSNGLSVVADSRGRILAEAALSATPEGYLVAEVPIGVSPAPYVRLGDLIPRLATAFLLLVLLRELVRGARRRRRPAGPAPAPRQAAATV